MKVATSLKTAASTSCWPSSSCIPAISIIDPIQQKTTSRLSDVPYYTLLVNDYKKTDGGNDVTKKKKATGGRKRRHAKKQHHVASNHAKKSTKPLKSSQPQPQPQQQQQPYVVVKVPSQVQDKVQGQLPSPVSQQEMPSPITTTTKQIPQNPTTKVIASKTIYKATKTPRGRSGKSTPSSSVSHSPASSSPSSPSVPSSPHSAPHEHTSAKVVNMEEFFKAMAKLAPMPTVTDEMIPYPKPQLREKSSNPLDDGYALVESMDVEALSEPKIERRSKTERKRDSAIDLEDMYESFMKPEPEPEVEFESESEPEPKPQSVFEDEPEEEPVKEVVNDEEKEEKKDDEKIEKQEEELVIPKMQDHELFIPKMQDHELVIPKMQDPEPITPTEVKTFKHLLLERSHSEITTVQRAMSKIESPLREISKERPPAISTVQQVLPFPPGNITVELPGMPTQPTPFSSCYSPDSDSATGRSAFRKARCQSLPSIDVGTNLHTSHTPIPTSTRTRKPRPMSWSPGFQPPVERLSLKELVKSILCIKF